MQPLLLVSLFENFRFLDKATLDTSNYNLMNHLPRRNRNTRRRTAILSVNAIETVKKITADFGILQHDKVKTLHSKAGNNLIENALALISSCKSYCSTNSAIHLKKAEKYLTIIENSQQEDGTFSNSRYDKKIAPKHLKDVFGYTIWSLGYLIAVHDQLPQNVVEKAEIILQKSLLNVEPITDPREISLVVKGLYFYNTYEASIAVSSLIKTLADRLCHQFLVHATKDWQWFQKNISLGDSMIPEALLCAFLDTDEYIYQDIAKQSFDFLLLKTFSPYTSINNKQTKSSHKTSDIINIVLALSKFFSIFKEGFYLTKINMAYDRFAEHKHCAMRVA